MSKPFPTSLSDVMRLPVSRCQKSTLPRMSPEQMMCVWISRDFMELGWPIRMRLQTFLARSQMRKVASCALLTSVCASASLVAVMGSVWPTRVDMSDASCRLHTFIVVSRLPVISTCAPRQTVVTRRSWPISVWITVPVRIDTNFADLSTLPVKASLPSKSIHVINAECSSSLRV